MGYAVPTEPLKQQGLSRQGGWLARLGGLAGALSAPSEFTNDPGGIWPSSWGMTLHPWRSGLEAVAALAASVPSADPHPLWTEQARSGQEGSTSTTGFYPDSCSVLLSEDLLDGFFPSPAPTALLVSTAQRPACCCSCVRFAVSWCTGGWDAGLAPQCPVKGHVLEQSW